MTTSGTDSDRDHDAAVTHLIAALRATPADPRNPRRPALDRAACTGRAPLFDADIHGETPHHRQARHRAAARLCATCPELGTCTATLPHLPRRTTGVWAGHLLDGHRPPQPIPAPDVATSRTAAAPAHPGRPAPTDPNGDTADA